MAESYRGEGEWLGDAAAVQVGEYVNLIHILMYLTDVVDLANNQITTIKIMFMATVEVYGDGLHSAHAPIYFTVEAEDGSATKFAPVESIPIRPSIPHLNAFELVKENIIKGDVEVSQRPTENEDRAAELLMRGGLVVVPALWVSATPPHPRCVVLIFSSRFVQWRHLICFSLTHQNFGHRTVSGIHYHETYAPTIRHDTFRVFLFIAAHLSNIVMQADAVSAYLAALQDTEVSSSPSTCPLWSMRKRPRLGASPQQHPSRVQHAAVSARSLLLHRQCGLPDRPYR